MGLIVLSLAASVGAEEAEGGVDVDPFSPGAADEDPGNMVLFPCILSNMIYKYLCVNKQINEIGTSQIN